MIETFEHLSPADLPRLHEIYVDDVRFKDPFNEVHSRAAVERIFAHMFATLDDPRFVIVEAVAEGDRCFVTWEFRFAVPRLGRALQLVRGASQLHFAADGRIALHRDYWDAAEELYEKLPLLGALMRWLKRRAAGPAAAAGADVALRGDARVRSPVLHGCRGGRPPKRGCDMADQVRVVCSFSTSVPDEPGQAFKVLAALVSAGVDLLGCSGSQIDGRARIDVVPADLRQFSSAIDRAALNFRREKTGLLIQGVDRTGALADNLSRLAELGINVGGVQGLVAGAGRWGAIVWVESGDVERAAQALGAGGGTCA